MSHGYMPIGRQGRYLGLAFVVALHLALAWLLVSGTVHRATAQSTKSLQAVLIQEVIIPPPKPAPAPPPRPKEIRKPEPKAPKIVAPALKVPAPYVPPQVPAPVAAVAAIESLPTPPLVPAAIGTPAAIATPMAIATPAPAAPASAAQVTPPAAPKAAPVRPSIQVACPTQIAPKMPRKALREGTEGVVKAQALIKDGVVREVTFLSGPRVFHAAVRAAMLQYQCTQNSTEILATQEFRFKIE